MRAWRRDVTIARVVLLWLRCFVFWNNIRFYYLNALLQVCSLHYVLSARHSIPGLLFISGTEFFFTHPTSLLRIFIFPILMRCQFPLASHLLRELPFVICLLWSSSFTGYNRLQYTGALAILHLQMQFTPLRRAGAGAVEFRNEHETHWQLSTPIFDELRHLRLENMTQRQQILSPEHEGQTVMYAALLQGLYASTSFRVMAGIENRGLACSYHIAHLRVDTFSGEITAGVCHPMISCYINAINSTTGSSK